MCATLVFTTAISGNLASYLVNTGNHQWVYDFHKGIRYTVVFRITASFACLFLNSFIPVTYFLDIKD